MYICSEGILTILSSMFCSKKELRKKLEKGISDIEWTTK